MKIDPAFRALLHPNDLADLSEAHETAYAVWADRTLAFTNDGWTSFAQRNGADEAFFQTWDVGASLTPVMTEPAGSCFDDAITRALQTMEKTHWLYECSSPSVYRVFHATFLPLDAEPMAACLIHHARVVSRPHEAAGSARDFDVDHDYRNDDGLVVMCSACRRVRRVDDGSWEFVGALVEKMPERTSHGLCEGCASWYGAPRLAAGRTGRRQAR